MNVREKACWLALLTSEAVERTRAKRTLYQWTIAQHRPLSDLAELDGTALRNSLPELTADQAETWVTAWSDRPRHEEQLQRLLDDGFDLLTRADALYPETLAERLPEQWLPYFCFYRGDIDLLNRPAVYLAGPEEPTDRALQVAQELSAVLAKAPCSLVSGFTKGIERESVSAATAQQGHAVVILPLGFGQAEPILRASKAPVEQGLRLELSPFGWEAGYTAALGRGRTLLVTAMAEALAQFDDESRPDSWPGHQALRREGAITLIWDQVSGETTAAWSKAGAEPFSSGSAAAERILTHLGLQNDDTTATEKDAAVQFTDAESAIARLGEMGRVPDNLARRLREAEEEGRLGDGTE